MIALIWVVTLIVLIASTILVYRMLITSNEFFSPDKPFPFKLLNAGSSRDKYYRQSIPALQTKIKSLEESIAYNEIQFSKLIQKVNEVGNSTPSFIPSNEVATIIENKKEDEEDWEELYYQENEKKVQLENELDEALQSLENANQELGVIKEEKHHFTALKSKYDARLIELTSLQNEINSLKNKLTAAAARENEMKNSLNDEIALKKGFAKIESENARLRSETEDQNRQLIEMHLKVEEASTQLARFREMKSQFMMQENEKTQKLEDLRKQIGKNKIFSH
ncbi:MAG: hypothetical protein ABIN48_02030 [Ginsengibacter sp.]